MLNDTHRTSNGTNHANVVTNTSGVATNVTSISNILDGTTGFSGAIRNVGEAGVSPVGTCIATEFGTGRHFITVLTLTDFIIGDVGAVANTTIALGNIIYTFPVGAHLHSTTYIDVGMVLTAPGAAQANIDLGIGSDIGTTAIADLTGLMDDYIAGQNEASGISGGAAVTEAGPAGAVAGIHTGISLNATGGTKTVHLNAAAAWDVSITGNLTATGVIVLIWDFNN